MSSANTWNLGCYHRLAEARDSRTGHIVAEVEWDLIHGHILAGLEGD